jgi:selenide,water dikinase
MLEVGVSAATDVTGFGLLGHLHEVVHGSGVGAHLRAAAVPLLAGAQAAAAGGLVPGGSRRNGEYFGRWVEWGADIDAVTRTLLFDAQTSGGLLMSVPAARLPALREALRRRGVLDAHIGDVVEAAPGSITVVSG